MSKIRVSVSEMDGAVATVRVDGVVDTLTAGEVEQAIGGLIQRERFKIIMDLAGVDYIASAGWGVFISHLKRARENAGDLRLSGMIPNVREIYELLEFDTILQCYSTAEKAKLSFDSSSPQPVLEGGPKSSPDGEASGLESLVAIGIDRPATPRRPDPASTTSSSPGGEKKLTQQEFLSKRIINDPFITISELCEELISSRVVDSISWLSLWWNLRKNGLGSKRARYRFARREMSSRQPTRVE